MSAERFVADARATLSTLLGTGAVSSTRETVARARALARRARGLGLTELAGHLDALGGHLEQKGALAFEPSIALADEVCAVHDRVEALASALALWGVERAFSADDQG
ncbi:MAG: hypothetical protein IT372_29025 [Polyangiaceae bacterium]|nr:hypothetical protein [Polyangiaceae bacterium]